MYNSSTAQKIRDIPRIGDVDIERLPQDLTRIYAEIVSLRRQVADGSINFKDENLKTGLSLLHRLATNLELILLTYPTHEQKEGIAFVAATANGLLQKIGNVDRGSISTLSTDSISRSLAAIVLYLIGNSQADAAEVALSLPENEQAGSLLQQRLIAAVSSLAKGHLNSIVGGEFDEREAQVLDYPEDIAIDYLWREIGLGVVSIAERLAGRTTRSQGGHFESVIRLAVSEAGVFNQRSVFAGPYRLARLLKILEGDILERAIINVPPPTGVDPTPWQIFLAKLAEQRPYLWENHREAVKTNFLNPGTSAVLTLPTGAGKSTLSELKIASSLYSGKKVIYLVPTHALENQINKNLRDIFTEFQPIGIELDGEYTEIEGGIESFPILVMTPERCLTFINTYPDFLQSVGLIVFDEFHLIHGTNIIKDRRAIDSMYCLLTLFASASHSDYLLISAMVQNGDEVASWVGQVTKRECILFNSTWKPTRQLHGCLVFETSKIADLRKAIQLEKNKGKTKGPPKKLQDSLIVTPECFFSMKNVWETDEDDDYFRTQILDHAVRLAVGHNTSNGNWYLTSNRNEVAAILGSHFAALGLKTLIFVDTPLITNSTAKRIDEELAHTSSRYAEYCELHKDDISNLILELGSFEHSYFNTSSNVAVHHGLLLPVERNLSEDYFKMSGGAPVLVATATLAQGINLPAEIVIIAGDDRYDEDGQNRERVKPHELLNAAGRAGRAGQSAQGAVILIPGEIVTIDGQTISKRWWELKREVFTKGDQCLNIEDPLEYFLDSLQESSQELNSVQASVLYRFKSGKLSETDSRVWLSKSFYAFKAAKNGEAEKFENQVKNLIDKRNELDTLDQAIEWPRVIGYKTGLEPSIVLELGSAIDEENFDEFKSRTVLEFIDWFFDWIRSDESYLFRLFPRTGTIDQIKRSLGLRTDTSYEPSVIVTRLENLKHLLKEYVQGTSLNKLNDMIPESTRPDKSPFLAKARNFALRLIPELSFGFGLLTMVILEKAKQLEIQPEQLSWNTRALASCIREGLDSSEKLFFKKNKKIPMRVVAHQMFAASKSAG